jgi:hypothetical protein
MRDWEVAQRQAASRPYESAWAVWLRLFDGEGFAFAAVEDAAGDEDAEDEQGRAEEA